MNIPTSNVIVSFEREAINKLFSQGATFTNLVEGITDNKDVLLFNHESNPNFIEFTHDAAGKSNTFSLVLIDPRGEFEQRFMMHSTVYSAAEHLRKQSSPKNRSPLKALNEKTHKTTVEKRKIKLELKQKMEDAFQKAEGVRTLYIAYGAGNNLDLWSGPHMVQLSNAEIQVDSPKKLTLEFVPIPLTLDIGSRKGAYGEEVNMDLRGLTMEVNARSEKLDFDNFNTDDPVYGKNIKLAVEKISGSPRNIRREAENDFDSFLDENKQGYLQELFNNIDVHLMVTDVLRQMISQVCGTKNVIILLPDLNLICRDAIDEIAKLERLGKDLKTSQKYIQTTQKYQNGLLLDAKAGLYGAEDARAKFYAAAKSIAHRFCMSFSAQSKDTTQEVRNYNPPTLQYLEDQDREQTYLGRFEKFMKDKEFFACHTITSDKGVPDPGESLEKIIKQILKSSKGIYGPEISDPLYESDTNVVALWSEGQTLFGKRDYANAPLFGGIETKLDPEQPVVVFGDQQLIRGYLYGGINLSQKKATVAELKAQAPIAEQEIAEATAAYETEAVEVTEAILDTGPGAFQGPGIEMNIIGGVDVAASEAMYKKVDSEFARIIDEGEKKVAQMPTKGDYLAAALEVIPLHPYDKMVLTDKGYNEAIRSIIFPPVKDRVGPFGDISYIPDDFSYNDEKITNENKAAIQAANIPVFRYNTTNPNITDMKFNFGEIYFSQLNMGVQKEVNRRASASIQGAMPNKYTDFEFGDPTSVMAYIRTRHFSLGNGDEAEMQIKKEIAHHFQGGTGAFPVAGDAQAQAELAYQLYEKSLEQPDKPYVKIDQLLPGNPITVMSDFIEAMNSNALQIDITTLPMMQVSNMAHLNSPCLLFAQTGEIEQTVRKKKTAMKAFYSGDYLIMGFKHQINGKGASSSFNLIKVTPNVDTAPEEDDPIDMGPQIAPQTGMGHGFKEQFPKK